MQLLLGLRFLEPRGVSNSRPSGVSVRNGPSRRRASLGRPVAGGMRSRASAPAIERNAYTAL